MIFLKEDSKSHQRAFTAVRELMYIDCCNIGLLLKQWQCVYYCVVIIIVIIIKLRIKKLKMDEYET